MSTPLRIMVLGAPGVGKSTFTVRLTAGRFVEEYDPTVEDIYMGTFVKDDKDILYEILDTAYLDFHSWHCRKKQMETSDGFIILFSLTSEESFGELAEYRRQIELVMKFNARPVVLVGTKYDLQEEITIKISQANDLAQEWGVQYFDVSSKTGENTMQALAALIDEISLSVQRNPRAPTGGKRKKVCLIL